MHIPMHPSFSGMSLDWVKWRDTYRGGPNFIDKYLKRYTVREDDTDFAARKSMSFNPPDAKAALEDVRNSMYQHLVYVNRTGGPVSYQQACAGEGGGIDRTGMDIRNFIGCSVLPEMLLMRKVGVMIDAPKAVAPTRAGLSISDRPYAYVYEAEKILNWATDPQNPRIFTSLLLQDFALALNEDFSLPCSDMKTLYRYFRKEEGGVRYIVSTGLDDNSEIVEDTLLDLVNIPFVVFEISSSLMVDICDLQIALLNLESADVNFCFRANFPIYTESYDPRFNSPNVQGEGETEIGALHGVQFPTNHQRPAFISPSSEPLTASMAKGAQIRQNIRAALNLSLSNLSAPTSQGSAPAKQMDMQGLTSGLAYIGMALLLGEQQMANHWAAYEKAEPARVDYPASYQIKSDTERLAEIEKLTDLANIVPSETWKKEMNKKIVMAMFSGRICSDEMTAMLAEVDKAPLQVLDRKVLQSDMENGLVSPAFVSEGVGYPKGEAGKAKAAHLERVTAIALAQTPGIGPHAPVNVPGNPAARGVPDGSANPAQDASAEKKVVTDLQDTPSDVTRGENV